MIYSLYIAFICVCCIIGFIIDMRATKRRRAAQVVANAQNLGVHNHIPLTASPVVAPPPPPPPFSAFTKGLLASIRGHQWEETGIAVNGVRTFIHAVSMDVYGLQRLTITLYPQHASYYGGGYVQPPIPYEALSLGNGLSSGLYFTEITAIRQALYTYIIEPANRAEEQRRVVQKEMIKTHFEMLADQYVATEAPQP